MKRFFIQFPIILILTLVFNNRAFSQNGRLDNKQEVTNGYEYIAYLPEGYDESAEYPVIVYLHGGQGIHDGENKFGDASDLKQGLIAFQFGPPNLINNLVNSPKWPTHTKWPTDEFVVIIPHLPRDLEGFPNHNDQLWDPIKVGNVVNHAFNRYELDINKFYLTGISLGAKGTWDYTLQDPQVFEDETGVALKLPVAIVPISGNADFSNICDITHIYVWAFHGAADDSVHPYDEGRQDGRFGSARLVEEYNNCNPQVEARLDLLKSVAHGNWNEYYDLTAGYNLYEWMLDHNGNKINNLKPYVNAGEDIKILLGANRKLTLYGYGYDSESSDNITFQWSLLGGDEDVDFLTPTDEKDVIVEFLEAGNYEFNLLVNDGAGKTTSDQISVDVLSDPGDNKVISRLEVLEDGEYRIVENGDRINNAPGESVTLRAIDQSGAQSVRFGLGENKNYRTIGSNSEGIYTFTDQFPWKPTTGEYIISVTGFEQKNPTRGKGITKQFAIYINDDPPSVLPVEFIHVSAKRAGEQVVVSWSTATEESNDFFTIERSPTAADHFEAIGTQAGAGDSDQVRHYSFTDHAPIAGSAYYRIKQTDFDGRSDYSKIVQIQGVGDFDAIVFPNPAGRQEAFIRLSTADQYTPVSLRVMDAVGNQYFWDQLNPMEMMRAEGHKINSPENFGSGLYFLIIEQGKNRLQKKFVIR